MTRNQQHYQQQRDQRRLAGVYRVAETEILAPVVLHRSVAVASIRRLRRPARKNILARRRADLARWLSYDGVLVALPILGLLWLGAAS